MRRATYRNAALISGAFFLAAAAHAWADSADRFPQGKPVETEVPELPAAIPAAVPAIAAEFDALQREASTAGLKVDWSALKDYYAAHGNDAIWTTSNGYTLMGQACLRDRCDRPAGQRQAARCRGAGQGRGGEGSG